MGRLEQILVKRVRRGPMDPADRAELVAGRGIVGNANQGGRRQVTIVEREVWHAVMREAGAELPIATRRANLVVSGLPLAGTRGRLLRIGGVTLRIAGETKPCERMEEAHGGLRAVMYPAWRGGAFAEVVEGGPIAVGDEACWVEATPLPAQTELPLAAG